MHKVVRRFFYDADTRRFGNHHLAMGTSLAPLQVSEFKKTYWWYQYDIGMDSESSLP